MVVGVAAVGGGLGCAHMCIYPRRVGSVGARRVSVAPLWCLRGHTCSYVSVYERHMGYIYREKGRHIHVCPVWHVVVGHIWAHISVCECMAPVVMEG